LEFSLQPASAGFLHSLMSHPEDGDDMFLRNVKFSPSYTALQTHKTVLFVVTAVKAPNPNNLLLLLLLLAYLLLPSGSSLQVFRLKFYTFSWSFPHVPAIYFSCFDDYCGAPPESRNI
jgi:hypothetical protein